MVRVKDQEDELKHGILVSRTVVVWSCALTDRAFVNTIFPFWFRRGLLLLLPHKNFVLLQRFFPSKALIYCR